MVPRYGAEVVFQYDMDALPEPGADCFAKREYVGKMVSPRMHAAED